MSSTFSAFQRGSATVNVDPESPWPGLASYDESALKYFFGRDREILDLQHRISSKPLTVFYGQSGLGKTSLLRAGLIPKLDLLLPVYLHLRFDESNPSLEQQVKLALFNEAKSHGLKLDLQADPMDDDVDLWQIFHDPEFGFLSADGVPVARVALIFDQFEELGTLGNYKRVDESKQFIQSLACVVENRPPLETQVRMQADEVFADRIVSSTQIVHTLLSLRNDYLHWLERYRAIMPSMMDCRLELRALNGAQALMAVLEPGKMRTKEDSKLSPIVDEATGRAIVSYVSGISRAKPLSEAQATPPILNLLCRQLNSQRLKAGVEQITMASVDSNAGDVLRSFLTETFSGKPEVVRALVEDKLVTHDGCRDFVVKASFVSDLQNAGVADAEEIVEDLVRSRLLTLEDRDGVARVELTHDVLLPFVLEHRATRHRQEEMIRRKIEEASQRTAAAKRFATGSLLVGLIASCLFAVIAWREAERAKAEALRADTVSSKSKERLREFANVHLQAGDRAWNEHLNLAEDSTIGPGHAKWREAVAQWGRSLELFVDTGEIAEDPVCRLSAISRETRLAGVPVADKKIHSDGRWFAGHQKSILSIEKKSLVCRATENIDQILWSVPIGLDSDSIEMTQANESGNNCFVLDTDRKLRLYFNPSKDQAAQDQAAQDQIVPNFVLFKFEQIQSRISSACWLDNVNMLVQFDDSMAAIWDVNSNQISDSFSCQLRIRPYHVSRDKARFLCVSNEKDGVKVLAERLVKTGEKEKTLLSYGVSSDVIQDVALHPTNSMAIVAHRPSNSGKIMSRFTIVEPGNPVPTMRQIGESIPATIDRVFISEDGRWMVASAKTISFEASSSSDSSAGCGGSDVGPGFSLGEPNSAPAQPTAAPAAADFRLRNSDDVKQQSDESRIRLVARVAPRVQSPASEEKVNSDTGNDETDGSNRSANSRGEPGYLFLFDLRKLDAVNAEILRLDGPLANLSWGKEEFLYALDSTGSLKAWDLRTTEEMVTATSSVKLNRIVEGNNSQQLAVDDQGFAHVLQPPLDSRNQRLLSFQEGIVADLKVYDSNAGQEIYAAIQRPESVEIRLIGQNDSSIVESLASARLIPTIESPFDRSARIGIEQWIEGNFKLFVWQPNSTLRELPNTSTSALWLKHGSEQALPLGDLSATFGKKEPPPLFRDYNSTFNLSSSDCKSIVLSVETGAVKVATVKVWETRVRIEGDKEVPFPVSVPVQTTVNVGAPVLVNVDKPGSVLPINGFAGFSNVSNLMAVANTENQSIELWDLNSLGDNSKKVVHRRPSDLPVSKVMFSKDDRRILIMASEPVSEKIHQTYSVSIWDLDNRLSAAVTRTKLDYAALSPSGRWLLTVDPKRIVNLIDLDSDRSNIIPIQIPQRAIRAIFSKDEQEITISAERAVIRWKPTNLLEPVQQFDEQKVKSLIQYAQSVSGLSFDRSTGELGVSKNRLSASEWQQLLKRN